MVWTRVGAVAATAVVTASSAMAIHHHQLGPGGHFVNGHADLRDVTVLVKRFDTGGLAIWSHTCSFEQGNVYVPVRASIAHGSGSVTLHITAAVFDQTTGDEVASATENQPMEASVTAESGDYVRIPLHASQWRHGARDCAITQWTVTDGAWYSNDD